MKINLKERLAPYKVTPLIKKTGKNWQINPDMFTDEELEWKEQIDADHIYTDDNDMAYDRMVEEQLEVEK